ncbi:MAG TPA: LLM class flavin-dependent oxidoreductase [Intrasporangium sp.]|uniref:LLM class flavin-dependent oxidoreductase n=1 Tax=Intrasporangium sp. TaxID=1925024 RepID=UPI002D775F7E|nr:LLM class flavin-dependent oxidoreductase [Intrasporangium sp.]HET7400086.1 LLM class flavin-dependent oxidoreductase [Intrasporangium sp.]
MSGIPVLLNLARPRREIDPVTIARQARAAGLSGLGFADSPRLFPDPLVETARVLSAEPEVMAGPCVLSLPLVHPARAASALSTLAGDFPGRVAAVVGRGESSLANEGLRPPALREYAALLAALRSRLDETQTQLPLMGAASGPRTIEVTARELGGVLLDVGVHPSAVAAAAEHARAAHGEARVWAFLRVVIAEDASGAATAGASLLGSCASRVVAAPDWYGVGADLAREVADLAASHDYRRHGTSPAHRVEDTGGSPHVRAAQLVRDRFILAATTEAVALRLGELVTAGISGVILAGGLPGVLTDLVELGLAARAVVRTGTPTREDSP